MRLIGIYNAPAMVTLCGLFCSVIAIYLAFNDYSAFGVVALIWAGIFDLFDGLVARAKSRTRQEAEFGVQIDSLVDVVSFGIAPIAVALSFGVSGFWFYLITLIYICATVQRLAYFNTEQASNSTEPGSTVAYYNGLPVTFAALIFGIGFSLVTLLTPHVHAFYLNTLFLVTACLYVAPIRIPKPKGAVYIIMPTLAVLFSGYWLMLGLRGS